MTRESGTTGFQSCAEPVASSRLIQAVVASLAIAALTLCLSVSLAVVSTKASMAMALH